MTYTFNPFTGNLDITGASSSAVNTFETINKNLMSYDAVHHFTGDTITSIDYSSPGGTITKTFNYTNDLIISIVLSGAVIASGNQYQGYIDLAWG